MIRRILTRLVLGVPTDRSQQEQQPWWECSPS
ncbi:MAG: hypothetical protein JWN84_4168 [Nocardioides sp.]|nr:hypothetical protein [Nocardioides sp.]